MTLCQISRLNRLLLKLRFKLSFHKDVFCLGPQQASSPDPTLESGQTPHQRTPGKADYANSPPHTARNVLKFSLQTLSAISSNIPLGQSLSSVIDPVLAIMTQIEQTSANTQGFVELAARIELLKPILSQMGTWPSQGQLDVANPASDSAAVVDKRSRGQFVLQALRQEFESMTKDLNAAKSQGTLQRFFDSADNAAYLAKHNTNLTQIISIATLVEVDEVSQTLKNLESKLGRENQAQIEMEDVTGGVGGTGGYGTAGGEGGEGGGPRLDLNFVEDFKFGRISGMSLNETVKLLPYIS